MSITVQQVIDGGFAKSSAARPGTIASPAELIGRVGFCLLETFQVLANENPYMIAVAVQVANNGTGWPRPANTLRVIGPRADAGTVANPGITPGAKIQVVPYDDQGFGAGDPCLTELGQVFVPTGQAIDPSAGTLSLVHCSAPAPVATVNDTIDQRFPDAFVDLLNFDMAEFLAVKDQRAEDEAAFSAMKSALLALLIKWSKNQTYELVQRFPIVTPPLTKAKEED